MINKKALDILFKKYWSPSKGWVNIDISIEDYKYAKEAGLMFDNKHCNHQSVVQDCITQCNLTKKEDVVAAFISSLLSKRLDLRSALSSYACGKNLLLHSFEKGDGKSCMVCCEPQETTTIDLNVLNFERHKFGGVRHIQPNYISLDLTIFSKEKIYQPTKSEINILKTILTALKNLNSKKISDAEKCLSTLIKSNKNERMGIIAALGYCGILQIPEYQPFYKGYISYQDRKHSNYTKSDWPFPSDLWIPSYGLEEESIEYWFGEHLNR